MSAQDHDSPQDHDDDIRGCASPPCFLHEVDPAYSGLAPTSGPPTTGPLPWREVLRWRKAERARLIAERLAIPDGVRREHDARIAAGLEAALGELAGRTVSAYWPVRGEPDLRQSLGRIEARGARLALPVVVAPRTPLVFRTWAPGAPLEPGVWGIPTPPADAEAVVPDLVIVPLVGFDPACHRLGYGGGFFDRTLAALPKQTRVYGVGYGLAALATIHPQPHDVPMGVVVTEGGVVVAP